MWNESGLNEVRIKTMNTLKLVSLTSEESRDDWRTGIEDIWESSAQDLKEYPLGVHGWQ